MIVVIADDLTGAGEIGGIGLACGLNVELQREFCPESDAELLIIDTDTRSKSPEEAAQVIRDVARCLMTSNLPVEWIYKKTDSVLRGPVASELEALQHVMRVARILLVPANPSKGRVVRDGNYFINEKLLSETDFANDPEHPARTSNVLELTASSGSGQIHLVKSDQTLLCEGIVVGQAETTDDLLQWSEHMDEKTIPAGAGEFFEAILTSKGFPGKRDVEKKEYRLGNKALFVCGSSSDSSRQALKKVEEHGAGICRIPDALFKSHNPEDVCFQEWSDEVVRAFENRNSVVIAIDREVIGNAEFARQLRRRIARIVLNVLQKTPLKDLFVEGGATASEIVDCLGWTRFESCDQIGPGVVRMKVLQSDDICLTIKPGSYPWPERIRNVFLKGRSYAD